MMKFYIFDRAGGVCLNAVCFMLCMASALSFADGPAKSDVGMGANAAVPQQDIPADVRIDTQHNPHACVHRSLSEQIDKDMYVRTFSDKLLKGSLQSSIFSSSSTAGKSSDEVKRYRIFVCENYISLQKTVATEPDVHFAALAKLLHVPEAQQLNYHAELKENFALIFTSWFNAASTMKRMAAPYAVTE